MKPLISVIIPCYNMENYIDRCVGSIVSQTIGIDNLELILVNDASTDHTLDKLKEWEARYPESLAVVTYEENLRQGGALNVGLQYAHGEYIGFAGADDWIEPDMYETLYGYAKNGGYDAVMSKFIRDDGTGTVVIDETLRSDHEYHFGKRGKFYDYNIPDVGNVGESGSNATNIYKKSIITDNEVYYPIKTVYEDNYWGSVIRLYIGSVYVVDRILYHYFINMNSTVTSRNAIHQLDRIPVELGILEEYRRRGAFELFYHDLEWDFISRFYLNTIYIIFTRFDYIPDVINDMRQAVWDNFPNYRDNPNISTCSARQRMLLGLLERREKLSQDELIMVKYRYLEDLVREKQS